MTMEMPEGQKPVRIVLADDHALVREGTRHLLDQQADMSVVGEAGNGEEAVRLVSQLRPDIAILDMAMPELNGVDATRRIKASCPDTSVLVLSAYDDDQYVFEVLDAGAAGYLLKDIHGRNLVEAIRAVCSGESVLHPTVLRKVLGRLAGGSTPQGLELARDRPSDRELEVLLCAARGMSNKRISTELGVSLRTVQAHLRHLFDKIGASSRTEAVIIGMKKGWLSLQDIS